MKLNLYLGLQGDRLESPEDVKLDYLSECEIYTRFVLKTAFSLRTGEYEMGLDCLPQN